MRHQLKAVIEGLLGVAGYRIVRNRGLNRFDALRGTLEALVARNYSPRIVLDCGANIGQWTRIARPIFPSAEFHLVEPQQQCHNALEALAHGMPGVRPYRFALTSPGVASVRMKGGGASGTSSGAWVCTDEDHSGESCPAATLDELFADKVHPEDRCFLKMDMEGHEIRALLGADRLLTSVEFVLAETWFIDRPDGTCPIFSELLKTLKERGFEVYDIATLHGRPSDGRLRCGDVLFARRDSPFFDAEFS
jgi:FkbM family methyltransferase